MQMLASVHSKHDVNGFSSIFEEFHALRTRRELLRWQRTQKVAKQDLVRKHAALRQFLGEEGRKWILNLVYVVQWSHALSTKLANKIMQNSPITSASHRIQAVPMQLLSGKGRQRNFSSPERFWKIRYLQCVEQASQSCTTDFCNQFWSLSRKWSIETATEQKFKLSKSCKIDFCNELWPLSRICSTQATARQRGRLMDHLFRKTLCSQTLCPSLTSFHSLCFTKSIAHFIRIVANGTFPSVFCKKEFDIFVRFVTLSTSSVSLSVFLEESCARHFRWIWYPDTE